MGDENRGWKWWQKVGLAGGLLFFALVALLIGMRRPWIEPLPGIRTAMTRPFVRESDLGPDSAYRLLLAAIEDPSEPPPEEPFAPEPDPETGWAPVESPPEPGRIWSVDWSEALTKLKHHPWPPKPPPAAGDSPPDPEGPWTLAQYEDIERLARLYEPKMAMLDQALAAPNPQVPTADRPDFPDAYLKSVRQMARWLAVSAHYRAAHGDYAGSCRDLERGLSVGNLVCRGGGVINNLVGIACAAIAADAGRTMATQRELPVPVLKRAGASFLTAADGGEPFVEVMRAEATGGAGMIAETFRQASREALEGVPAAARGTLHMTQPFLAVLLHFAGSAPEDTARNMGSFYQHLVKIADQPYSAAVQTEYEDFARDLNATSRNPLRVVLRTRDPIGLILTSMLVSSLTHTHQKAAQRDAMLRGMALFLAIHAYEQERGALPETLDQLVPDYLPRVPSDPFDGKPFRYLRSGVPGLPPEAWAVYSIGGDFADDGGDAHSVGTPRDREGTNPDLVWPSQGYPLLDDGTEIE